ncbi:HAMP domain-containing protein [Streptosporangiaceae bacterium NEAU-GS5]|nr:HAMP domain-containing protein [Streptosporangiaceae bacterium NEAU-GS5]
MRLSLRLFVSHAGVAVVGAVVAYLSVRLLAPALFDHRIGMMNGTGPGPGMDMATTMRTQVHAAFLAALDSALALGLLAGVAVAAVAAAAIAGRLLRPLDAVRAATRRVASGHYDTSAALPTEPELAALATDVNTLARALADTESRRTRLLGDVAHEMRTPLTALDGYVEGMIDGVFAASPDTLASLSAELRRLHRLADDLSSLSRTQEQRLDLRLVDADLADLARRAATRLASQFEDAHVTLIVDADDAVPVRVDPDRIMQVLTNLLGNALLATPAEGTVTISVRRFESRSGRRGDVVVTDTGVGVAGEDIERIFERFYRVPGQRRRSAGSGVGLTIARGIARGHGGDVTVSSPGRGHGSTFVVTLPLRPI